MRFGIILEGSAGAGYPFVLVTGWKRVICPNVVLGVEIEFPRRSRAKSDRGTLFALSAHRIVRGTGGVGAALGDIASPSRYAF